MDTQNLRRTDAEHSHPLLETVFRNGRKIKNLYPAA